jgi:hypothetical protein
VIYLGTPTRPVSGAAFTSGMYVFISRGASVFGVSWKIILTPSTSRKCPAHWLSARFLSYPNLMSSTAPVATKVGADDRKILSKQRRYAAPQ